MPPETLDDLISAIVVLKKDLLCSEAIEGLHPIAEQHTLLALDHINAALRNATLANYHQMRGQ